MSITAEEIEREHGATDEQGRPICSGKLPEQNLRESEPLVLDPKNPLDIVDAFITSSYTRGHVRTLHHVNGTTYAWAQSHYVELASGRLRAELYEFLEHAYKSVQDRESKKWSLVPFKPTKGIIDLVIDALHGRTYIEANPPCWLTSAEAFPDARELVVARNGIIDMTAPQPQLFHSPMPELFSVNALDYDFNAEASTPALWLHFLKQLWPDDQQAIDLLQEWFGYTLSQDAGQQKILMLIGPPRSGKGTIARVLTRMIGAVNVCGPTLASLGTNFGLASLRGKQLAIFSDARLSGRTDQAIVLERLLSISGGDMLTIDLKYAKAIEATLLTRLMFISNELPRLSDSSGALVSRLMILQLTKSFLGQEDTALTDKLCTELPGILLWALTGWRQLQHRGHFLPPVTSADIVTEMNDLASPVSAFVRDWCNCAPAAEIPASELFEAWGVWCHQQGRDQVGTIHVFGRDLRATMPELRVKNARDGDGRTRTYRGVKLTLNATTTLQQARAARRRKEDHEHP